MPTKMRKKRFNHIEPREQTDGAPPASERSFRRQIEKGLRFPAVIRAFIFRRKIEIAGREREADQVEIEKPEEVTAKVEVAQAAAEEPSRLEIEREEPTQPGIPRPAQPRRRSDRDFSKTRSELEKLAGEIKDFEPPFQATKTAGQLRKEEFARIRKREAEIADLVYRDAQPARTPSKTAAIAKICVGGFVLLLFLLPVVFAFFPGTWGILMTIRRFIGPVASEFLFYLFILGLIAGGGFAGRRYRR